MEIGYRPSRRPYCGKSDRKEVSLSFSKKKKKLYKFRFQCLNNENGRDIDEYENI